MRQDFIHTVQHKVAISAIPPSTFRGSKAGLVAAAREFLRTLDLSGFAVSDSKRFATSLDRMTVKFWKTLPRGSGSWGVARKALNLFLRDAFYNTYLRKRFKLLRAESCLEIPLDGVVAHRLRRLLPRKLPAWPGVKLLTKEVSDAYQMAAMHEAHKMNLSRVHLDIYLWTNRE